MDQEAALSIVIARLIGPLFLVIGIGALFNGEHYRKMIAGFLENAGLYYLSGVISLIVGLAIVAHHNIWAPDWRVIITVLGWIALFRGAVRLMLPTVGPRLASGFIVGAWPLRLGAVLVLVIGGILTYAGFAPS